MKEPENEAPEDDCVIYLIDYGISKKIDQLSDPEQLQRIEQLKILAGAPNFKRQNTFQT
jgi:hypothetical protein